jgi:AraC-like DNA-binding protein
MKKIIDNLKVDILRIKHTTHISTEWSNLIKVINPFTRLYYVKKGYAEIIINGKKMMMTERNFYLIPSNTVLTFIKPENIFNHYWIHFRTFLEGEFCLFDFMDCPFELPMECFQKPEKSFKRLVELWEPEDSGELLECKGIILLFLSHFVSSASNKSAANETFIMLDKFKSVLNYMEKNITSPNITLKKLGKIAGMHPTYFSNTFKKWFGTPPLQYMCRMRIMKAQKLLVSTELTVQEIAFEAGYQDPCFFSRLFKKYVGVPPGLYRKMNEVLD